MLDRSTLEKPGGWGGYRLARVVWPESAGGTVELHVKPTAKVSHSRRCGARCREVHETVMRRVRGLPLFEHRVAPVVPRRRVWCEQSGGPHWAAELDEPHQRVTDRLAVACSQLSGSAKHIHGFHNPLRRLSTVGCLSPGNYARRL